MYKPENLLLHPNVPVEAEEWARKDLAGYYAHISAIDEALGGFMDFMEEEGLSENTVFIYTSDHGDMVGSRGFRDKRKPWDESVSVPFLLRYPDCFHDKPRTVNYPLNTPDIYPTVMGLCALDIPESVEGFNWFPILTGAKNPDKAPKEALILHPYSEEKTMGEYYGAREYRGIRTERYTYVRDLKGPWLLYDNENDPYQINNLIDGKRHSELRAELDARLNKMLKKTNDEFLPGDEYIKRYGYIMRPARVYTSEEEMAADRSGMQNTQNS